MLQNNERPRDQGQTIAQPKRTVRRIGSVRGLALRGSMIIYTPGCKLFPFWPNYFVFVVFTSATCSIRAPEVCFSITFSPSRPLWRSPTLLA
ncbi:hypothetical protein PILCRDRAFT_460295 [Piloderma croceum F 1598]|uniref:Uncharacterized protein n=1 Tax=Piloderma croceum (strain F 1598) TaxID=765440 RepID=A0A0C3BZT8_PILCF|nr:hypothetical protein PILCRDRAFT_460295 [Piloderma croceum F 1598]